MHRMHCDATLRALNGAVCERRLGRVLATIEPGAPLLSDQLNAGDLTHLALCCTCLLDVNTWSSVVELRETWLPQARQSLRHSA